MTTILDNLYKPLSILNEMVRDAVIQKYAIAGAVGAFIYLEPTFTADLDVYAVLSRDSTPLRPIAAWLGRGMAMR